MIKLSNKKRRRYRALLKKEQTQLSIERDREQIEEVWDNLYDSIFADEERFENKITLISAGALSLLMTFIASIGYIHTKKWLLWVAIISLVTALMGNLAFYLITNNLKKEIITRYDRFLKRKQWKRERPNRTIRSLSKRISRINWGVLICLFIGIVSSVMFVLMNY